MGHHDTPLAVLDAQADELADQWRNGNRKHVFAHFTWTMDPVYSAALACAMMENLERSADFAQALAEFWDDARN